MQTQAFVPKTIRSRFIEILMGNPNINSLPDDKMRKVMGMIMEDMDADGVLDSIVYNDGCGDWDDDLETISDIQFDESRTASEKAIAIEFLRKPKEEKRKDNEETITLESLKRIREKRREMAQDPESDIVLTDEDLEPEDRKSGAVVVMPNSYGRSPLHEAIGLRNLESIKKFVDEDKYLDVRDNNGNTPYQMAYQEGYTEAVEIFERASITA